MGTRRPSWPLGACVCCVLLCSSEVHADPTPAAAPPDAPLSPDPRLQPTDRLPESDEAQNKTEQLELWVLVAPSRWSIETYRRAESAYGLRAGVQMVVPFKVTALLFDTALEGSSFDDALIVAWPVSIGYGLRLAFFEVFAGGTFGALFPNNYGEGGRLVGLFASSGFNVGVARFHAEFRYNYLLSGTSKLSYVTPGLAASFRL